MKKIVLLFICSSLLLGFTGCGSKQDTLKCTGSDESTKTSMVGTFKDSKLTKLTTEATTTYDNEEDLDSEYGMLQLSVGIINAIEGVEGTLNKDGLTVTMKYTADLSKMSTESIKEMFDKESMNKEEFEEYAQEEGLTCK